jgi:hypothetical protein
MINTIDAITAMALRILPRIKIGENRMNEAALREERIGEVVSIMRLRLRSVLQECSSSLHEINCGSCCSAVLLRRLGQTSVARRRRGAELASCGLGHFPQLQFSCDILVMF